jgi:hypothetical protein
MDCRKDQPVKTSICAHSTIILVIEPPLMTKNLEETYEHSFAAN